MATTRSESPPPVNPTSSKSEQAAGEAVDLSVFCRKLAERAKSASFELLDLSSTIKNQWLEIAARQLLTQSDMILSANAVDLAQAPQYGLTPAAIDRLTLTSDRIQAIAVSLRAVAALPDPVGEILGGGIRPNGLEVKKVRVPIGVVLFIYESRPNVTADAAAIAIKSGNAIILRGGKEAYHTSLAITSILAHAGKQCGLPDGALQMVNTIDRAAVGELLKLADCIDLVIPRGGESLVRRVTSEATMPVLKHFNGNCHVYVDRDAEIDQALAIVVNAKTNRMGVCNAAESLVVHSEIARSFLPKLNETLGLHGIELRGDPKVCSILPQAVPASEADWGLEYLGPILSIRIVDSVDEAIAHINRYGSKHTDAIVTRDLSSARRFTQRIDSAAVIVNASTRFNDGGELGLGAEIGISTDKLHARGPCGLTELTTYKYIITGDGQVRS
jgi:glutamate-5-semialdehyde dehydrogenase